MKKTIFLLLAIPLLVTSCNKENHFHEYGEWIAKEEVHERKCSCGDIISIEHNFDNGKVIKEATHLEEGKKIFTCQTCGYEKEAVIKKLNEHVFNQLIMNESTKVSDANCVHPDEYYYSCVCGEVSTTDTFYYGNPAPHTFEGGIHYEGSYKTSYCGGEFFDLTGLVITGHCSSENKDISFNKNDLVIKYQNGTDYFECGDTKIIIGLKNDLSTTLELPVVVDHSLSWDLSSKEQDICVCSHCHQQTSIFDKTLDNNEPQILEILEGCSINIDGISPYISIESINVGKQNLGNDITNLDFSKSEFDKSIINGTIQNISVVVKDSLNQNHTIDVPVKIYSKLIENENDLLLFGITSSTDGLVKSGNSYLLRGYFEQTQDITITGKGIDEYKFNWNYGFGGIYEGNNHLIKTKSRAFGIFGNVINGTISNLRIEDSYYTGKRDSGTLCKALENSTIDNVDIKCTGGLGTDADFTVDVNHGAVSFGKVQSTSFINCDFDYSGQNVAALLSISNSTYYNSFEKCTFVCNSYKKISGCPNAPERDVYVHDNISITGTLVSA